MKITLEIIENEEVKEKEFSPVRMRGRHFKRMLEIQDVMNEASEKEVYTQEHYDLMCEYICEMEFAGTEIDLDVLKEMDTAFDETIEKLANDIYRISGTTFNISSPKQLGQVLFEDLGLKGFVKL